MDRNGRKEIVAFSPNVLPKERAKGMPRKCATTNRNEKKVAKRSSGRGEKPQAYTFNCGQISSNQAKKGEETEGSKKQPQTSDLNAKRKKKVQGGTTTMWHQPYDTGRKRGKKRGKNGNIYKSIPGLNWRKRGGERREQSCHPTKRRK